MDEVLQKILHNHLPVFGWDSKRWRIVVTVWLVSETYAPWHWTQQPKSLPPKYFADDGVDWDGWLASREVK